MNWISILIAAAVSVLMVLDIRYLLSRKSSGCSGACGSCNGSCPWQISLEKARSEISKSRNAEKK